MESADLRMVNCFKKTIDRECAGQECSTADIAAVGGWVTRRRIFVAKALEEKPCFVSCGIVRPL